ncbi:MAG: divergent polysaccharide deacetylase family protein [Halioglobus sp.]
MPRVSASPLWQDDCNTLHQHSAETVQQSPDSAIPKEKILIIIIDDIGHQLQLGRAAVDLPGKLNFAVLPHTPYGKSLAERAHQLGKEVLLHAPMSNVARSPAGPGELTAELSEPDFRTMLSENLAQVPYARGVNNHMGSALTQQRLQMGWVMEELQQRDLYFVDSRTINGSVAARTAQDYGVPHLSRQVFLDNERSHEAIHERFREVLELVNKNGSALAIGHPYPETIDYLRDNLPLLAALGIKLAYVSERIAPPRGSYSRTSTPRSAI